MSIFQFLFNRNDSYVPINLLFIEEQKLVKSVLRRLKKTLEKSISANPIFIDPITNQKWEKYTIELNEYLRIMGIGLRRYPNPSTEEVVSLILVTKSLDELAAACNFLYLQEIGHAEFRHLLIDALEKNIDKLNVERFEIIYRQANLADYGNKRLIQGLTIDKIKSDHDFFKNLTARANELRDKIAAADERKKSKL